MVGLKAVWRNREWKGGIGREGRDKGKRG